MIPEINSIGYVESSKGKIFCEVVGYATIGKVLFLVCMLTGKDSGFMVNGLYITEFICHPSNFKYNCDLAK